MRNINQNSRKNYVVQKRLRWETQFYSTATSKNKIHEKQTRDAKRKYKNAKKIQMILRKKAELSNGLLDNNFEK